MTALLPTDACPECVSGTPVHPWCVDISGQQVKAAYECPACGHRWPCWWTRNAVNLPCPGCPECEQAKRDRGDERQREDAGR
jgi:hypothetical protein